MATFIILSLDLRRPKNDGSYPIIFRLTHNTKTTSISSGYSAHKKYWDIKNRCLRSNYTGTESPQRLNNFLYKRKAYFIDLITKLQEKGELKFLSIKQLKDKMVNNGNKNSVFAFIVNHIEDLKKSKRIGTAISYQDTLRSLKKFRANKDLTFNELNLDFLKKYETEYLSRGNSLGGLAVYMRTIRAIYNKAIKDGQAESEGYPFKNYTIRNGKTRKRAIPMEAIQKIKELKLKRNTTLYNDRNIFLMSFYLRGMPYTDLAHLKVSNIIDSRIQYDRQKTQEPFDIMIPEQLIPILKYFTKGKKKDDYLLSAIKRENPLYQYRDVEWARKRYNKNLKAIAQMVGIEEKLTSYVSRHSYASIADDIGIPLTAISQMLGHEKVSTTQAYLDKLRKSKLDKYQKEIISGLK